MGLSSGFYMDLLLMFRGLMQICVTEFTQWYEIRIKLDICSCRCIQRLSQTNDHTTNISAIMQYFLSMMSHPRYWALCDGNPPVIHSFSSQLSFSCYFYAITFYFLPNTSFPVSFFPVTFFPVLCNFFACYFFPVSFFPRFFVTFFPVTFLPVTFFPVSFFPFLFFLLLSFLQSS